jgi:hypothetical protein
MKGRVEENRGMLKNACDKDFSCIFARNEEPDYFEDMSPAVSESMARSTEGITPLSHSVLLRGCRLDTLARRGSHSDEDLRRRANRQVWQECVPHVSGDVGLARGGGCADEKHLCALLSVQNLCIKHMFLMV